MNKKYLAFLILAVGGYFFYSQQQKAKEREAQLKALLLKYQNQAPPSRSRDWYYWISLLIGLYGEASSLWEPGGPFYRSGIPDPSTDANGWNQILSEIKNLA